MAKNPYEILGVNKDAGEAEIKVAYPPGDAMARLCVQQQMAIMNRSD